MNRSLLLVVVGLSVGCSGAGGTSSVPRAVADSWSAKWCQAAPGNTKEQLIGIMGAPTGTTDTTLMWSAYQYQFNAFLDPDGTVNQLDNNVHSLSEAEKAALTCATVRTKRSVARAEKIAAAKPRRPDPVACTLVSEAEMSTIQLTVVTPGSSGAVVPASRIDRTIDEALNVLAWEGVVALGLLIVLAPFALVALAAWLGRRLYRRHEDERLLAM